MNSTNALIERGLQPIPSEYIEQYLSAMISTELECIEFRPTEERLVEAKQNIKGVEVFISRFGGLHSRVVVTNMFKAFYTMTLEDVLNIVKEARKEMYE